MNYSQTIPNSEPTVSKAPAIELGLIGNGYNGRQILFDAINEITTFNYWMNEGWDFTPPRRMPDGSIFNTVCELVNNKKDTGLFNLRTVYYNRIHTSTLSPIVIQKGSAVYVSDLLDVINSIFQTKILATELFDTMLPSPDGSGNVNINLVFPEGIIQYYSGSPVILTTPNLIVITAADIGLGNVDNTRDLQKPISIPTLAVVNNAVNNAIAVSEQYARDQIAALGNTSGSSEETLDGGNF